MRPVNDRFKNIEWIARLMDSQFRIPGTNIRFGLDALIGLVPGAGDLSTFAISSFMLATLAKNGASGYVVARMAFNVVVDAVIGSIPLIGDLFDIAFKANERNLRLMRQHYVEGRHKGGAWKVVVPLILILLILLVIIGWLSYRFIVWIAGLF